MLGAWRLQASLGYWDKEELEQDIVGHRKKQKKWRGIREGLVTAGLIEIFKGTVEVPYKKGDKKQQRIIQFVRLLEAPQLDKEKPGSKVSSPHRSETLPHLQDWEFSMSQWMWNTSCLPRR